ncbi:MAG: 16S rRNA (adenine(1518)-N(6)/adenine(1519)-N(6))-dimethyltransferase RsmA [Nitrospinae bacterium]|nr:16S rRNA (adenine(1518)-N(6)/adenine(1519)-N(6))-dimethyltransferase RsmA [Nitrospinota bacterium]MDA1109254.1 16S rRNA (adenine(1518)-N(6)/adenine(1519)-N(6))-dimethyltransferase RsmA [Nitrospinota bacterium]
MKKRPLGQNFLTDLSIAQEIVQLAGISPADAVLEIGPGKGVLTRYLLDSANPLTALEIDKKLCQELAQKFAGKTNFQLIEADATKFDYSSAGPRFKVISNLPYYAATHIVKRLIDYRSRITDMTVMLQKEVVDRFVASPGQKEYGSLSVFIQFHCQVERLLEIPNTAFFPPPKIDSSLVKLTPRLAPEVQVEDQDTFFKVVHAAFFHKRKMLKNNLKVWEDQFLQDNNKIRLAGIDLSRRGETLSMQEFATLSNYLHTLHD